MEPTHTPPAPAPAAPRDRSRTGALWVTATGAFLVFAAAAVFVAVRWDTFSDQLKLALLAAVTGGAVVSGRLLRQSLPAAGTVLAHLGAFLIPVNSAAVAVHLHLDWPTVVLVEGLVATVSWAVMARLERSITLWRATAAAVVVTAAGIGATTVVPAPLALAGAAFAASSFGRPRPARAWALVAGLVPALTLAASGAAGTAAPGSPAADQTATVLALAAPFGLTASVPAALAVVTGLLAAVVLTREGRRKDEALWLVPAGLAAASGLLSGWATLDPSASADLVAVALAFLGVEVAAAHRRSDPFWRAPLGGVALAGEVVAGAAILLAGPWLLAVAATHHWSDGPWAQDPRPLVAGILAAAAWLVADLRRRVDDGLGAGLALLVGGTFGLAAPMVVLSVALGAAAATGSPGSAAVATLVAVAGLLLGARPGTTATAVLALTPLALVVDGAPVILVPVALASTGLLTLTALRQANGVREQTRRAVAPPPPPRPAVRWAAAPPPPWAAAPGAPLAPGHAPGGSTLPPPPFAPPPPGPNPASPSATTPAPTRTVHVGLAAVWIAALAAVAPVLAAAIRLSGQVPFSSDPRLLLVVVLGGALVTWASGVAIGTWARPTPTEEAGIVGRLATLTFVLPALWGTAGTIVVLAVVDAARTRSVRWAWPVVPALPLAVATTALALGGTVPVAGLALCVAASVLLGCALLAPDPWSTVLVATGGLCAGAGLALVGGDAALTGVALIVLGGTGLGIAASLRNDGLAIGSWAVVTIGCWIELRTAHAVPTDLYALPVAIGLLGVGFVGRRRQQLTSWVAYGLPIALLGGTALLDRVVTGDSRHALLAGAVGVVAVVVGGSRRLLAPLLLGTALLVAVTGYESLAVTRTVPTWAWLAGAGTALMVAGIVLERRATGPLEAGRRIVDLVHERFS